MKKNIKGFSIIEILVGIFIFTLGLASVYGILVSTLNLNDYNKYYIIATNLAREEIELFKNIRDINYTQLKKFNQINPAGNDYNNVFQTGSYYKLENDYDIGANFSINVEEISDFGEGKNELNGKMQNYRLYLDSENRYVYNSVLNKSTPFYRFLEIEEVKNKDGVIKNALKIKSKVIWYKKGYHEYEINTIITDWIRL